MPRFHSITLLSTLLLKDMEPASRGGKSNNIETREMHFSRESHFPFFVSYYRPFFTSLPTLNRASHFTQFFACGFCFDGGDVYNNCRPRCFDGTRLDPLPRPSHNKRTPFNHFLSCLFCRSTLFLSPLLFSCRSHLLKPKAYGKEGPFAAMLSLSKKRDSRHR